MRVKANLVRWLVCVSLLLLIVSAATEGKVIYVDDDAVGANDGTSWQNAYTFIQDALADADSTKKPVEIRVAQGTYKPDQGSGQTPGDREATFQLINGVTLAGGYAGFGKPDPNARNVELYETILSGDLEGNDVDVNDPHDLLEEPTYNDNSHHIVTSGGNGPDTIIDGFIISHGNGWGSGIKITSDGPTILKCTFKYNSGSAINSRQSNLRLNECSFVGNRANSGGGVWSWGNAVLISCVFRDNSARDKGGAVAHNGGMLELIDCEFVNNSVSWSLSYYDGTRGGALWAGTSEKVVIQNCIFNKNAAPLGGAIRGYGNGQIDNCVFTGNLAEYGGALFGFPDSTIKNCIFSGNRAVEGGALCTDGWGPNLINCTLADNWAQNSKAIGWISPGRGVYGLVMTITNCILWNGFDEIRLNGDQLPYITITHTNIQGGWPSWPWQGIIYSDPCFVKQGYWIHANNPDVIVEPNDPNAVWIDGDYHLKSQAGRYDPNSESWAVDEVTSPCIDAGDPNSPVAFEPLPNGGIVNMGAYGGTAEASKSPSGIHAKYGGGKGEPNNPYLIYTAEQMNTIGANWDDWDKDFKLMADIDLSSYTETDFNIIGTGYLPAFTGVFDGNGHTISNFSYTSTDLPCVGIFGYIDGPDASISNLGLIDPNVDAGTGIGVGSLAGWIEMGAITNCYAEGGSVSGKGHVGGLVGKNTGSITDCYATASVTGISFVGGLVGENRSLGRISGWRSTGNMDRCYATGSVTGYRAVGGLVGANHYATVMNCFSTTDVIGEDRVGGLIGENDGDVGNCYSYCTVDAEDMVGGLVGRNDSLVTASYSRASVTGWDEVGGLVGYNSYRAEIVDCYANGDVLGQMYVGGLVGNNATTVGGHSVSLYSGTIRNCYSVAVVSGDEQVGGLVGRNGDGGVSGSFWDIETSGQTISDGGVGRTTAEMQDPDTFIDAGYAGWDFVGAPDGPSDIWAEPDGGGYPVLWWQLSPLPELPAFSGGTGEPDEPYLISTGDELNSIGHNPRLMAAHFKLVDDIDLADTEFFIIASLLYPFRGTFDGNGHTISNFGYIAANETYTGFFRYAAGAQIKNLGLIWPDVHVDRGDFHGCLIGYLDEGVITNCYVEAGRVSGYDDYIGGLLGSNSGTVTNCYFTGAVYGHDAVGGLVGDNGGSVMASYSYASVKGRSAVGGLVGRCSPGETINCYARGDVVGQWYVGGLVGSDWGGEVRNCFWDIETSGRTTSYGGTGKTTAEMQMAGTFLDAGWDFVDETENGTEDIWYILEGQDYPRLWWELIGDNLPAFAKIL